MRIQNNQTAMANFRKSLMINANAEKVFDALTCSIPRWWTEMFEGISNEQGKYFTIRFGPEVFKTMRVEVLLPYEKVVWVVTDSLLNFPELKNKAEWIDTKIVWKISVINHKTILQLTHFGLTPEVECYDICENGWQNFTHSLVTFIHNGKGIPYKKES